MPLAKGTVKGLIADIESGKVKVEPAPKRMTPQQRAKLANQLGLRIVTLKTGYRLERKHSCIQRAYVFQRLADLDAHLRRRRSP